MDEIITLATQKLIVLGYDFENEDLIYYANLAYQNIKNAIGSEDVPVALNYVLAEMTAGLYMQDVLLKGGESGDIKTIKEGDISLTYENGNSVWDITEKMIKPSEDIIARFRRIVW